MVQIIYKTATLDNFVLEQVSDIDSCTANQVIVLALILPAALLLSFEFLASHFTQI